MSTLDRKPDHSAALTENELGEAVAEYLIKRGRLPNHLNCESRLTVGVLGQRTNLFEVWLKEKP